MGAINYIAPGVASGGERKNPVYSGESRGSARNLTPKEFAGRLTECGVNVAERTVRDWCAAGTLATIPGLPGRWLIPAGELARFQAVEVAS